jgi:hypothetical protein
MPDVIRQASRLHRLFHWIGIALATPIILFALGAFYGWLHGEFPSTVTAPDALLVLLMLLAAAGLVYGASRAIGWVVLAFSGRQR